ncbi:TPA: hypothetical protein N2299_001836 [Enterobacter hormaechei]|nr:hypothetical protein [Enterobacter hormaechei]ELD3451360.1 hypothetical protein [Enterobacter hormaechei]EMA2158611.1 hypothetical protein [Enterobacter hormaechei]MBM0988071.1 hypothetical protein [Enterobacter hormaechei]HBN5787420.1 hypothetical protein [Enterobacter hormaechei]
MFAQCLSVNSLLLSKFQTIKKTVAI